MSVRFVLNGEAIELAEVDPHLSLLEWLRSSGRTGTKEGCAEGECGACAVAWLSTDEAGRTRYAAINSCLVPLVAVHGRTLVSVEGIAEPDGALHPVQRAMVERGGSQCGYCTPGFVVSLFCEYYRPGRSGYDAEAISGNLCRCTGYRPIVDVARGLASPAPSDRRLPVLAEAMPALSSLQHESGRRRYLRPTELKSAFAFMEQFPEARLVAGGTDVMVPVNQRHERYDTWLSLEALSELRDVEFSENGIVLGAGVPLAQIEALLHERAGSLPLLEQVLPLFSSRLVRQRATLGGNLGTASPIGDTPPVLLALDAELSLLSAAGERRLPLSEFFLAYRRTALRAGELIGAVHIALPQPRYQRFYKVSKRVLDDISTVAAAFALELDDAGKVTMLRAAFGGVAATPLRARALEDAARGRFWNQESWAELLPLLQDVGTPQTDLRGSADYRRAMLQQLFRKFCAETRAEATP